jgi:hypothetical protein
MSADLAAPVQQLGTLAHTLFASLGPAATRPPPPPPVAAFIAADDALRAAVAHARTHQARQRRIAALEEEVLALDARWRAAVAALEEGRRELAALIDEGDTHVSAMQRAKECMYTASWVYVYVLTFAHSCRPAHGAPRVRARGQRIHLRATRHARPHCAAPSWRAAAAALLPAIPQRREDAPRATERRGATRARRRDA